MPTKISHAADLLGLSRLTVRAVTGVAEVAEAVQLNIIDQAPAVLAKPLGRATTLVYRGVRGVTRLVGGGIDGVLARLHPLLGTQSSWSGRDALLAAVNGVLGDYLARTGNPLAIEMGLRRDGEAVDVAAPGQVSGRIVVLVHGLCMNDLQWQRGGHDHGALLQRERGYTPLYLHYNSGLHISENGRAFADQLDALVRQWPVPVEQIVLVGHSMGGLVSRSACHYGALAGHGWLRLLDKMVFLGSPHHGAPLERGGNWFHAISELSVYTAPFSQLGKIRSAGITDLRHGSLLDIDWEGRDRFARDVQPQPVALPDHVACHTVAAVIGKDADGLAARLAGDGLVPLESALGRHADAQRTLDFAPARQAIVYRCHHIELLHSPEVGGLLLNWL